MTRRQSTRQLASLVLRFFIVIAAWCGSSQILAQESAEGISNLHYLADESPLDAEQVMASGQWTALPGQSVNFGFDERWFWFRFDLAGGNETQILQLKYPLLDQVTLYLYRRNNPDGQQDQGRQQDLLLHSETLGFDRPFGERQVEDTLLAFQLPPNLHADYALLQVHTNSSVQVSLSLKSLSDYWRGRLPEIAAETAFHAILWAMLAYNLMIFGLTRHPSFLLYCLSITATSFMMATLNGWTFRLLWPDTPAINDLAIIAGITATEVFASLFGIYVLRLNELLPAFYRLFLVYIAAALLSGAVSPLLPYSVVAQFQIALGFAMALTATIAGLRLLHSRDVLLYFIALSCLLAGMLILILRSSGLVPVNAFTIHAAEVGYLLQVIFLGLSIGERHLKERRARIAAQDVIIAMQRETNEALEHKVRERTADLQRANRRLHEESTTDALTQVRNRRHFDQQIEVLCQAAARSQQSVALLLIDIDHFKQVNDTWGHQNGDIVLRRVAEVLDQNLDNKHQRLFRYGGEEFAVLLENTSQSAALALAETLRQQVAAMRIRIAGEVLKTTISTGVAAMVPEQNDSPAELCHVADQALYRAKNSGRNRVMA